ncbi:NERD domain protein [Paraburkholderia ribeironis]|uniref:NERD domain protein n=1 Tax=Paraburkholderia ribeironis TaxID=1247936 RepID=A0A1N7RIE5_9BURK|nr:nuclease-related domain-containing protein [Paraburkholderia ribeironis]SIT34886.1 NERD domain protein [Paraburkholderia ribeironis]
MHWIIFAAAVYLAWRFFCRKANARVGRSNQAAVPTLRSEQSGDAGEAIVQAELHATLSWLCGDNFYLHDGPLLLNHAPGTEFPTAEVDHLAITPFGIFVVETKNWTGQIMPGRDELSIVRVGADGHSEVRRSPLAQNRSKVGFLRSVLPAVWWVESIAVFPNKNCELSPALPVNLMRIDDLRQWLRTRMALHEKRGRVQVNVHSAREALMALAETGSDSIHRHRLKVRENPKKLPHFS